MAKVNFSKLIESEKLVLVDFSAEWCGPCKALAPILKEVSSKISGKAKIYKLDIDKNRVIADRYNIRSVPTLILFKNGQIAWRQSGVLPANQIAQVIENHA
jgi:thioredoxin 1